MNSKDILLNSIRRKAEQEARLLAGEFARAASKDREELLAALQFEQWLAQSCAECLAHAEGLI